MAVARLVIPLESRASAYYKESAPSRDLCEFVACNWVRMVPREGPQEPAPIVPDGCADIIVCDDAPPRVVGPDSVTRWVQLRAGTVIVGIRARPGTLRSLLGCPAGLILDGGASLSDLAPGAAALHQRLLSSQNVQQRYALLEGWVRGALARAKTIDRALVAACRWLTANPQVEVGELARTLGWSARTLQRQFHGACGYGPKHFQRIMRTQRALHVARGDASLRLAHVAAQVGYADQAHMTRDFRDITGFTPARYFERVHPELSAWIGDPW